MSQWELLEKQNFQDNRYLQSNGGFAFKDSVQRNENDIEKVKNIQELPYIIEQLKSWKFNTRFMIDNEYLDNRITKYEKELKEYQEKKTETKQKKRKSIE
jgi:hypothetical protein